MTCPSGSIGPLADERATSVIQKHRADWPEGIQFLSQDRGVFELYGPDNTLPRSVFDSIEQADDVKDALRVEGSSQVDTKPLATCKIYTAHQALPPSSSSRKSQHSKFVKEYGDVLHLVELIGRDSSLPDDLSPIPSRGSYAFNMQHAVFGLGYILAFTEVSGRRLSNPAVVISPTWWKSRATPKPGVARARSSSRLQAAAALAPPSSNGGRGSGRASARSKGSNGATAGHAAGEPAEGSNAGDRLRLKRLRPTSSITREGEDGGLFDDLMDKEQSGLDYGMGGGFPNMGRDDDDRDSDSGGEQQSPAMPRGAARQQLGKKGKTWEGDTLLMLLQAMSGQLEGMRKDFKAAFKAKVKRDDIITQLLKDMLNGQKATSEGGQQWLQPEAIKQKFYPHVNNIFREEPYMTESTRQAKVLDCIAKYSSVSADHFIGRFGQVIFDKLKSLALKHMREVKSALFNELERAALYAYSEQSEFGLNVFDENNLLIEPPIKFLDYGWDRSDRDFTRVGEDSAYPKYKNTSDGLYQRGAMLYCLSEGFKKLEQLCKAPGQGRRGAAHISTDAVSVTVAELTLLETGVLITLKGLKAHGQRNVSEAQKSAEEYETMYNALLKVNTEMRRQLLEAYGGFTECLPFTLLSSAATV